MVHRFSHEFNLPGGPIKTQIVAGLTPRVRSMVWVQPELCIHKEFPSDADPAGLRTKLSEPIVRRGHKKGIFPGQDNQRLILPKTHLPELLSVQILAKSK